MSSGILGTANPASATNATIYEVPATKVASCSVSIVNRGPTAAVIRLALAVAATPTDAEFIEYGTPMAVGQVLERTGLVLDATKKVVVYSDVASISAVCYGFED